MKEITKEYNDRECLNMVSVGETIISVIGKIVCTIISSLSRKKQHTKKNKKKQHVEVAEKSTKNGLKIFDSREKVESLVPLDERIKVGLGIKEIRILNFACTSILSPNLVDYNGLPTRSELYNRIEQLIHEENIDLAIVISAPESEGADDALNSEKIVNLNTDIKTRRQVFYQSYGGLQKKISAGGAFYNSYCSGRLKYRITKIALPYAIFQVKYKDSKKDHIKIDLYSPYISRESRRRSFFVYKNRDNDNYEFFNENFDNVFKNAMSKEEEDEYKEIWLAKAEEYSAVGVKK